MWMNRRTKKKASTGSWHQARAGPVAGPERCSRAKSSLGGVSSLGPAGNPECPWVLDGAESLSEI